MEGYVVPGEPKGRMVDGAYFHPAPTSDNPKTAEDHPRTPEHATKTAEAGGVDGVPESTTTTKAGRSRAIVVLTDIFGLPLQNCKIIADALSARVGCDVWVPDLFNGTCACRCLFCVGDRAIH